MAKNGQINTNTVKGSYFWVKWEKNPLPVIGSGFGIFWSCGVYCNVNLYNNAIWMSAVTINDTKVYEGGTYSNFYKGDNRITSGVLFCDDKTDSITVEPFSGWLFENNDYFSDGGSFSLEDTDGATITFAPDFTDVDNPVITYSNPSGSRVTSLKACISLTGETDDVEYRDISIEGSSYTFELEDAERELLRNSVTSAPPSRKVIFRIRTEMNGEIYKSDAKSTFTVTENEDTKPTVNIAALMLSNYLPSEFDGLCIQGKSKVKVGLDASGKYGAKIESYSVVVDGKTYNGKGPLTDFLQTPGEVEIVAYATDSRGFTGSAKKTINVLEYAKPLVIPVSNENAIQCYRSDGNGNRIGNSTSVWIKARWSCYKLNGKNECALLYRVRPLSEAWDNDSQGWQFLLYRNSETDEYDALIRGDFAPEKSYSLQIKAVDTVGDYDIKTFVIPTQAVALHLGKDGENVTIGDYCDYSEPKTFRSAWKAIFDGGVQIGDKTLEEYIKSVINGG